jgi:uncharacterized membrane protein (DUF373 family)
VAAVPEQVAAAGVERGGSETMKNILLDVHDRFETFIVSLLLVLLMIVILIATAEFTYLLFHGLWARLTQIDSLGFMQSRMHVVFAGFLVILLGIELLETVKMYLTDHVIHVEVVYLVAMIAVGRHIIEVDYNHVAPMTLFGTATLVVGLSLGYYLLKKSGPHPRAKTPDDMKRDKV